ncbi:hypothetical protein [Halorubrum sp. GN11_10-6_MGM]|uniref:hypothetical protein n=1 Tax=Halorubrum sp. GN11_10-6_MGM TaxID=2518112 RepID=UPI0037424292
MYPRYRTIAGHSAIDLLVRRWMYDHLVDLAILGILDRQSRNEGRRGGQHYGHEFSVDLRTVQEVLTRKDSRCHSACDTCSETERTLDAWGGKQIALRDQGTIVPSVEHSTQWSVCVSDQYIHHQSRSIRTGSGRKSGCSCTPTRNHVIECESSGSHRGSTPTRRAAATITSTR